MRKLFSILFYWFLLAFIAPYSLAQELTSNDIQNYFKEINVDDGLSAANVNAITKDKWGFMWFGTEYGLNRYDGNEVRVYQSEPDIETSLSSNLIYDILADNNSNIWAATKDGLNKYNHLTEEFTHYKDPSTKNIFTDIEYDAITNRIWVAANGSGLKYLDLGKDSLINYPVNFNPLRLKIVGNNLIIGTKSKGIVIMNKYNFEILKVISPSLVSPVLDLVVFKDSIWAATSKNGLIKFSINNFDAVEYFNATNSGFKAIGALCLDKDKNGNLLIGTDGKGFYIYDSYKFYSIIKSPSPNGLRSNTIRDIFVDNDNNIWLGTYARGINMQPSLNRSIINFQHDLTSKSSLSKNFVMAVEESKKGRIYIGTNRGGLNMLENNVFSKIDIPGTVVLSLHEDSKERLWIGTYQNGIFLYENNKLTNLADILHTDSFNANSVWSITEDAEKNIWLGLTNYLLKINGNDFTYIAYQNKLNDNNSIINNTIRSLLADTEDRLWVGTIRGLSIFNLKENKFDYHQQIKPFTKKLISSIASNVNNIFIGTHGEGIYIYNKNLDLVDSLSSKKDGLVHNVILDLVLDNSGNIWATTPNGVSKINTTSLKIENFTSSDGFIGNTFNPRSGQLLRSGNIALGSTMGLSIFNPDSISFNTEAPTTLLTGLKVLNEEITIHNTILDKPITYTNAFSLPPALNAFSINYVGLHYANPNKVVYKYKLEGFENEWRIAGKRQTASYTNLTPGNYTFKVIASSGNNSWTESPASVQITVLPYWWQTPLAAIVFIFAGLGILALIVKIANFTLSKQKNKLESQVKERTFKLEKAYAQLNQFNQQLETKVKERTKKLEKSNSELDRFVYSASHDLGAPLKSIIGLLNLAKIDDPKESYLYFNKIEISIKKLEDVIQNLIRFSRNSRQEIRNEEIDLKSISEELKEELIYADPSGVECNINVVNDFNLTTDPVRLKIILSNFISNAIKYQSKNKLCIINLNGYKKDDHHFISIEDNGIGIEEQYLEKIFDMFYRATTMSDGSGLGLYIVKESAEKINAKITVKSSPNKGSTFTIGFSDSV